MSQKICSDCPHPVAMHWDQRGCHTQNCRCKNIYSDNGIKRSNDYFPPKISEREIPEGSTYLKELWAEMGAWHGDILKT